MTPDYTWLADYLQSEIKRLGSVERFLKDQVAKYNGEIAKWKHYESNKSKSPIECEKMISFAEHKIDEANEKLSRVSPKISKLKAEAEIMGSLI